MKKKRGKNLLSFHIGLILHGLQRHQCCCRFACLWDVGLVGRLFVGINGRIWCISLQIFESLGKTHINSHLISTGTPQKQKL